MVYLSGSAKDILAGSMAQYKMVTVSSIDVICVHNKLSWTQAINVGISQSSGSAKDILAGSMAKYKMVTVSSRWEHSSRVCDTLQVRQPGPTHQIMMRQFTETQLNVWNAYCNVRAASI